jgi:hypothetical protein
MTLTKKFLTNYEMEFIQELVADHLEKCDDTECLAHCYHIIAAFNDILEGDHGER